MHVLALFGMPFPQFAHLITDKKEQIPIRKDAYADRQKSNSFMGERMRPPQVLADFENERSGGLEAQSHAKARRCAKIISSQGNPAFTSFHEHACQLRPAIENTFQFLALGA